MYERTTNGLIPNGYVNIFLGFGFASANVWGILILRDIHDFMIILFGIKNHLMILQIILKTIQKNGGRMNYIEDYKYFSLKLFYLQRLLNIK